MKQRGEEPRDQEGLKEGRPLAVDQAVVKAKQDIECRRGLDQKALSVRTLSREDT